MIASFIDAQMTILRNIMQEMITKNNDAHDDENERDERESSTSEDDLIQESWSERWNSIDVDFFDLHYEDDKFDSMIYTRRDTIFRDVHLFNERVKDVAAIKFEKLVAKNLYICLRDTALKWYTSKLFDMKKRLLKLLLKEWTNALMSRFKKSSSVTLIIIIIEKYIMNDAYRRQESRAYAQIILRDVKLAKMSFIYN